MTEGYYRVSYKGIVQVARYYDEPVEDLEDGVKREGVWHLAGEERYISSTDDITILGGPIAFTP